MANEIAIKDMYSFKTDRSHRIEEDCLIDCLVASCYLGLVDLSSYCFDKILQSLSNLSNLFKFASKIQFMNCTQNGLVGELGVPMVIDTAQNHTFVHLLSKYHTKLYKACLGIILYTSSLCTVSTNPNSLDEYSLSYLDSYYPTISAAIPLSIFLAQLPLIWIEKVIGCDSLVIESEYDRYELVKQILHKRQSRVIESFSIPEADLQLDNEIRIQSREIIGIIHFILDDEPYIEQRVVAMIDQDEDTIPKEVVKGVAGKILSLFDNFLPGSKKRKFEDEGQLKYTMSIPLIDRPIRSIKKIIAIEAVSIPQRSSTPMMPKTLTNIFESGIIYTYMTFPQLIKVKKDEIVPINLALESYWLQTELGNDSQTASLPPLRFSSKFVNLKEFFGSDGEAATQMSGTPFECAGIQYRLLLCRESNHLKALLQKTRGRGPRISYSIYCFDHRVKIDWRNLAGALKPITTCLLDGQGYAREIVLDDVKMEVDDLWLTVSVKFEQ